LQLYLVRHGIAAERGSAYPDDTLRPLTDVGRVRMRVQARALAWLAPELAHVLTSPLVRTRQTAELVSAALATQPPVVELAALRPDGTPEEVRATLGAYSAAASVALVGHEPNLSVLAAALTRSSVQLGFKKGAICRLDLDPLRPVRPGTLRWFATPKLLRLVGRGRAPKS